MRARRTAIATATTLLVVFAACKEGAKTEAPTGSTASPPTGTDPGPTATAVVNTGGLAITMSFVTGEHSKDSNSQSYSVAVDGDSVSYTGPHPPCERGRCAHGSVKFKLDKAVYDQALAAITKGDLTRPLSEEKEIAGLGNYVDVAASVTVGDQTGDTKVRGMTYVHDKSETLLSDEAQARAEAVRMLLIPFRQAGEERLPKK